MTAGTAGETSGHADPVPPDGPPGGPEPYGWAVPPEGRSADRARHGVGRSSSGSENQSYGAPSSPGTTHGWAPPGEGSGQAGGSRSWLSPVRSARGTCGEG
ncbi:hypothetical protein [Streptosporangium saharense]|uniref:hypothetical protein n=1 Tax=Streptosporangium saharense TaxID=1706840 RepID=UPI0033283267